jgi:hypothetical protein
MNEDVLVTLDALRAAGAARFDAVGWHYIETLAGRTQAQSGQAQTRLKDKLQELLHSFAQRMQALDAQSAPAALNHATPSSLADLLRDMRRPQHTDAAVSSGAWRAENPRIQQFRKQLNQISVQKQVKQAIAQAPVNAGPINSHMLVLRSLGWMRDISPDYLNRFMGYVDTLLALDESDKGKATVRKTTPVAKHKKQPQD